MQLNKSNGDDDDDGGEEEEEEEDGLDEEEAEEKRRKRDVTDHGVFAGCWRGILFLGFASLVLVDTKWLPVWAVKMMGDMISLIAA